VVEFGINKSDGVTAVSNFLREETFSKFNVENEIKVIYNFIDQNRFKRENKEHFRNLLAPHGEAIMMHTSNFRKVKRVEDTLYMLQKVRAEHPTILLLVGDGPERTRLEKMARDMGLGTCVRFLGKQEAIEELLSIADLFVLPSGNESFGLAALEAMACEVPVISSNAGGLPEVNIHGQTGYLHEVGDVDAMAQYAVKLLKDQELLAEFRQNALNQANDHALSLKVEEYENYYQEVYERSMYPKKS